MSSPERCAPASERREDQLHGTAAPAERFVLVEQPGAWGRSAIGEWRGGHPARTALLARCRAANVRLLLIRRLHREPDEPRRFAIVDARPGSEETRWGTFADDAELAELAPTRPVGKASCDPVLLVCTHGRRDVCCATRGWPVVQALTSEHAEWTWQCSHVGGDRFAANLVVLPHGLYYGHLTPASALAVVRAHLEGRVTPASLRGRACFSPAVQAAQHYARSSLGLETIEALAPLAVTRLEDDRVEVLLEQGEGKVRVVLEEHESAPVERLTCVAVTATPVRYWSLREVATATVR